MARNSNWLSSKIALGLSLLSWTLIDAAEIITNFCQSLPDTPSDLAAIETQFKHELDQIEKEISEDFYAYYGKSYRDYCAIFLREPTRPRQILPAYWLNYDGFREKINRIRVDCVKKISRAPVRQLCELAAREMEATSIQHLRNIQHLIDNVSLASGFQIINHKNRLNPFFYCRLLTIAVKS